MIRRPNPIAGLLWMLLSCALLSGVAALVRYVAVAGLPPLQIVFLRILFGLLTMLPFVLVRGTAMLRTERLDLYIIRVVISIFAMSTFFASLAYISVGEMTAITFVTPLLATVGAALFLRETVSWQQWAATAAGLFGAMVILRPGLIEIGIGSWLAVASALFAAGSTLFIKRLTATEDPDKIVFLTLLMQAPLALLPALWVWTPPSLEVVLCCAAMGAIGTCGHVCLTRAFASADASLVMGADFARLPFAVFYGFILFGELIDVWTWTGAGIIFFASLYGAQHARRRYSPK